MATTCTRCENTGYLNIDQLGETGLSEMDNSHNPDEYVLEWIKKNEDHDVQVCDCCGDGDGWYGTPGEHYNNDDPPGNNGPYAYNGGLCECH